MIYRKDRNEDLMIEAKQTVQKEKKKYLLLSGNVEREVSWMDKHWERERERAIKKKVCF